MSFTHDTECRLSRNTAVQPSNHPLRRSRRSWYGLRKLSNFITKSNPRMTRLLPNRPRRSREIRVGKGSGCNHDIPRPCIGFGVQGRAAFWAEVQSHLATFLSVPDVQFT